MTDWTTIRVKQAAKDRAEEQKPDHVTWSEWVADEARAPDMAVDENAIADAVTDDLLSQLPPRIADELR
jgi:hypothetical protein